MRGLRGEHTPIGADGTVDISPSARFCIAEGQIIADLYRGLARLQAAEAAAELRSESQVGSQARRVQRL